MQVYKCAGCGRLAEHNYGWTGDRCPSCSENPDRTPAEQHQGAPAITYELEYIKCGKAGCKCATSQGHGPYWYAYWKEQGRIRKRYIGKELRQVSRSETAGITADASAEA